MPTVKEFKVGDLVKWESQSSGHFRRKVGVVMTVVPSHMLPRAPEGLRLSAGHGTRRRHKSYLVQVGGRSTLYWPLVKNLRKATIEELHGAKKGK